MIDRIEAQKLESIRQRNLWLEQERNNYLNDKRANIDFTGKLLKIAQEDPNLWREIKDEMYQKRLQGERKMQPNKAISMARSSNVEIAKSEGQQIDFDTQRVVMIDGMKDVMNNLGGQMARDAESRINIEEGNAAGKIQKKFKEKKESKACILF